MKKTSLISLLSKKTNARNERNIHAERSRALRLESLESRELLSATETFLIAPPLECVATQNDAELGAIDLSNVAAAESNAASSGTWLVSSTADDANVEGTLRYALANAANGDTITFDSSLQGATAPSCQKIKFRLL